MARSRRNMPLVTSAFDSAQARAAAYEELFYGSDTGLLVLADILQANGVFSASFTAAHGFDPVAAAHADGQKAAALTIFTLAGGRAGRMARAMVRNQAKETRDA